MSGAKHTQLLRLASRGPVEPRGPTGGCWAHRNLTRTFTLMSEPMGTCRLYLSVLREKRPFGPQRPLTPGRRSPHPSASRGKRGPHESLRPHLLGT